MTPQSNRNTFKHVIILGQLTMQIVSDYERDGGLTRDKVDMILKSISGIYAVIGKELGLEDQVKDIFKEVCNEVKAFADLPIEVRNCLNTFGEGIA
tara:strand:+ start:1597 stop:1884 length:288 start_codon:yes stop_codon:yes gene_type:complete